MDRGTLTVQFSNPVVRDAPAPDGRFRQDPAPDQTPNRKAGSSAHPAPAQQDPESIVIDGRNLSWHAAGPWKIDVVEHAVVLDVLPGVADRTRRHAVT